jgi:hypothetical protein
MLQEEVVAERIGGGILDWMAWWCVFRRMSFPLFIGRKGMFCQVAG